MSETEREKNAVTGGTLYLVATPIGNLADVSERAVKVLSEVGFVAAEDTRNSGLLLSRFGIRRPLVAYHEHNRATAGKAIVERLKNGESCALVTDAGTPAISDPGEDLVGLCAAEGIPVTTVPGCCAAVSALAVSGLPTRRFFFEGFLPTRSGERRERLSAVAEQRETVILYEAPHRLLRTLSDLCAVCGEERRAVICRELTKLNEETKRGTLRELSDHFTENPPRGEFVIVLDGCRETPTPFDSMTPREHVDHYVSLGMSENDAIKAAARDRGVPKNEIYSAVKIK